MPECLGACERVKRDQPMTAGRFEELICWQNARTMTNLVCELTRLPSFRADLELVRQIRAAAISAMSTIAEGFERWSRKEFVRFPEISKSSTAEVRSQLYTALDQHYLSTSEFAAALAATEEASKTTGGLIGYINQQNTAYRVHESSAATATELDLPEEFCNVVPAIEASPDPQALRPSGT